MRRIKTFWKLLTCASIFLYPAAAQRTPFRPADIAVWRTVDEIRIAPNGKMAVYVESGRAQANAAMESHLWEVSTDGRTRRPLTEGAWRDWSPRWASEAPEGDERLAYISDRTGKAQIRIRRMSNNQDLPTADLPAAPVAIAISPAGDSVAFTARVAMPDAPSWAPAKILEFLRPASRGRLQLFLVPATGGVARRLTPGDLDWRGEPAWMPDGRSILCEAAAEIDPAHPMQGGAIFSIRLADGAMRQLTQSEGSDSQPTPSPDGSRIAWLSTAGRTQSYNVRHLFVMNPDGSRAKQLTGSFDRDVSRPQWSSDSRTVYFLAEDAGAAHVYAGRSDGTIRPVTKGKERLRDFSLADDGRAAAIRSSATEAGDAVTFAADLPGGVSTLYAPNSELLANRNIGEVEELHFDSAGHSIQAWLVKPPSLVSSKRYPLIVDLNETARTMYGYEFQLRAQILASAGFVTLLVNPRGTPSYGEQFGSILATRNPGDDADDVLHGIDAAAAKSFVDGKRVMVAGGLLAAWLLSHSDRFSSAVLRHPVADRAAEIALAPEGLRRAAAQMGALPWDDPAQYWQHSPIYFAGALKTPTLILAKPGDTQAQELYFALQARKVESALAEVPAVKLTEDLALQTEIAWFMR